MEGVAQFNYQGGADDELSFNSGNILKIISFSEDRNWFKAELNGREGFVPKNYIRMKPNFWYMGNITRAQSEEFLLRNDRNFEEGAFIVRDSESNPNSFALSVKFLNQNNEYEVQHYRILRNNDGRYLLWVVQFDSINELIDHHRSHSVARTQTLTLRDAIIRENLREVRAGREYQPLQPGEIGFDRDDSILVLDDSDDLWWRGRTTKDENFFIGIFPSSYVSRG